MTELNRDILRLFAVPGSPAEAEERSGIERSLAMRVATRSLHEAASTVEDTNQISPEVFDTLSDWVRGKPAFWSREVGHLWRAVHYGEPNAIASSLVDIAIQANVSGIAGAWSFSLMEPKAIRVCDIVLDSVRHGKVECCQGIFRGEFGLADGSISVEAFEGRRLVVQSSIDHERELVAPSINVLSDQYRLVPSLLASIDLLPAHGKLESEYDDDSIETGIEPCSAALSLLHNQSHGAYNWVSSVIREIIPLRAKNGGAGSTSCFWDCGTIAATLSSRQNALLLREMLIHEASHQHFFLAKQLGALDDGSDTKAYFSPMVNAARPLEKMLLGYHALVNMLLYYEGTLLGPDQGSSAFIASRITYLFEKLNIMSPILNGSTALTLQGQSMFERLGEEEQRLRTHLAS
jgi:hypothetical protein